MSGAEQREQPCSEDQRLKAEHLFGKFDPHAKFPYFRRDLCYVEVSWFGPQ